MNNKRKQLTILTIALSLPLSAIAITTLSSNRFAPATKPAAAMSYVSTEYDGYRLLTSQYGVMPEVEFVIAKGIQVMMSSHMKYNETCYYLQSETLSTNGTRINTSSETAFLVLKNGASGRYILNKKNTSSNIIWTNPTESLKYGSAASGHNNWVLNHVENGDFTIHYQHSSGNYYLGYREFYIDQSLTYGYQHKPNENPASTVNVYVNVQSVIDAWATKYLAFVDGEPSGSDGQCVTKFDSAKEALDGLGDMFKTCLSEETGNAKYLERYQAWAKALGKSI